MFQTFPTTLLLARAIHVRHHHHQHHHHQGNETISGVNVKFNQFEFLYILWQ